LCIEGQRRCVFLFRGCDNRAVNGTVTVVLRGNGGFGCSGAKRLLIVGLV